MNSNFSERNMRGPAIARYVCFGSGGPAGATATGRLWTVLGTEELNGLNVYRYRLDYLEASAHNNGRAPADLSPWLPWKMDKQRLKELRAPPARWWTPADGPPEARADPPGRTAPRAA